MDFDDILHMNFLNKASASAFFCSALSYGTMEAGLLIAAAVRDIDTAEAF